MSRKLIAFDLDGTLLDDEKRIPPENLRALEAAAARGWVPVPATGRIVRGIPEPVKALPGLRYFIVSNGAGVYDAAEDRLLYRGDVPLELALRCYEYMDTLPWHQSQKRIESVDGKVRYQFRINTTNDFVSHIISRTDRVKALSPKSLIDKIKERLTATLAIYP